MDELGTSEVAASGLPGAARRHEKRTRFLRVAAERTQKVLERLQLLAKCGNRIVYEYGEEDVAKIFAAIDAELAEARRKFEDRTRRKVKFTL